MLDFIRIGCAVPSVKVGDVQKNVRDICAFIEKADRERVDILLFPELCLTGCSCGDLFFQDALWSGVRRGLQQILECSAAYPELSVVVGLPVRCGGKLFDCAAFLRGGILGCLVPKQNLSGEQSRWFAPGQELMGSIQGLDVPDQEVFGNCLIGTDILVRTAEGTAVALELGEDLCGPVPVSSNLAVLGAEVILNCAAAPETVGSAGIRRAAVKNQSRNCHCVYAFVSAGRTESTSDLVYSGHGLIAENGSLIAEHTSLPDSDYLMIADCDLGRIRADRLKDPVFRNACCRVEKKREVTCAMGKNAALRSDGSCYPVRKLPFIPSTRQERLERCNEIFQLQVSGLKQRLSAIGNVNAVIGISGGLDSTLALLVAVEAMRQLGRPASDVYGVTMPCFGTSDRTYNNSWELMRKLGINCKEIPIRDAVSLHFRDIGHDSSVHNATYENAQARERTQILMDYASVVGGIVVGTGDLSELALGWCTYNGDHMSMYGVNGTVPKTLIRWMIDAISEQEAFVAARPVLLDILDTPISPELLPPDAEGKISQQTEDLVGPYALHDFFLYYALRWGFGPKKIYALACRAFSEDYDDTTVKKWLKSFYRRFFTQQFKRNCMPDGVKVGSVSLGPRGDWRMPSDASSALWLEEADSL